MSIPLVEILSRIKQENLTGPLQDHKQSTTDLASWKRKSVDPTDDSIDPRWHGLFNEYFIDAKNQVTDDILFFVKKQSNDPIMVKRRIAGQMPAVEYAAIDWKETFFLNLISQLPCVITVAVCRKRELSDTDTMVGLNSRNGMISSERITKKVYATPYKSRVDVKDALMNECSYPMVYYTINDYESKVLHLSLERDQYLCVELSVLIPHDRLPDSYALAHEIISNIPISENSSPFPTPDGYSKTALFQGAVSFAALASVYQQRGLAQSNQVRNGWGKLSNDHSALGQRTEYVLMRGPHGKGQCQVAIQDPLQNTPEQPPSFIYSFFKNLLRSKSSSSIDSSLKAPEKLDCSLTYVNVPWQSITVDLLGITIDEPPINVNV